MRSSERVLDVHLGMSANTRLSAQSNAAVCAVVLAEAEFLAGKIESALILVTRALDQLRRLTATRSIAPALLNQAAYSIACARWDAARAAARDALGFAQETQRHVYRLWALQHLAAVAALD